MSLWAPSWAEQRRACASKPATARGQIALVVRPEGRLAFHMQRGDFFTVGVRGTLNTQAMAVAFSMAGRTVPEPAGNLAAVQGQVG